MRIVFTCALSNYCMSRYNRTKLRRTGMQLTIHTVACTFFSLVCRMQKVDERGLEEEVSGWSCLVDILL